MHAGLMACALSLLQVHVTHKQLFPLQYSASQRLSQPNSSNPLMFLLLSTSCLKGGV